MTLEPEKEFCTKCGRERHMQNVIVSYDRHTGKPNITRQLETCPCQETPRPRRSGWRPFL